MSPLNRGPLLGPRMPPAGMRPRFGGRLPMPGMPPRMPPPPMGPMFGPMRQRMMPPRPGGIMRPGGPPPLFGPRGRGVPPLMPPMMCPRGMGPRGPPMRPGPRGLLPPQGLPHMRPRFPMGNGNIAANKAMNNTKKVSKLEELQLKKPWMTDEIRSEIQNKNKLYAKAKKNKDAKEWNEFKDLRNKVTRMIRDAKNEYLAKNPEQAHLYEDDNDEAYDTRDEMCASSDDEDTSHYCEVCDREFGTAELLDRHAESHKTCGIDGCTFSAHPKLVEKHISMQHCTGLYHRMKNLSTPEDISKWIAERKKKYPTKTHIQLKQAEETEKRERGEIIDEKKSIPEGKYKEKINREKKRRVRKRKGQELKDKPEIIVTELYRGLRPFAGTANLCRAGSDAEEEAMEDCRVVESSAKAEVDAIVPNFVDNISDDEEMTVNNSLPVNESVGDSPEVEVTAKAQSLSCLGSLVADYGSGSSGDEGPEEVPVKRARMDVSETSIEKPENDSLRLNNPTEVLQEKMENESLDKTEVDERKKLQVDPKSESNHAKHSKPTKFRPKPQQAEKSSDKSAQNSAPSKFRNKKRLMLLQRLLSRSIQHERNIICQCIKYIADNNFLA